MKSLESQFNADMQSIYLTAKKELGYNATRFLQIVSEKGGLKAAQQLIAKDAGIMALKFCGRTIGWIFRLKLMY